MTQENLGEKADLNPKYIGEVERMEKTISVDALVRIAKALKVRVRDLTRGGYKEQVRGYVRDGRATSTRCGNS